MALDAVNELFMNETLADVDVLATDPNSAIGWYQQGDELANQGRYAEALISFNRAIASNSSFHEAWVFRAVVLIHLEQYQVALESCDRALECCPTNSEAWLFRGVALQRLGQYQQAYASYDRAVGKVRKSPLAEWVGWLKQRWQFDVMKFD